jgi:hypothetical protein
MIKTLIWIILSCLLVITIIAVMRHFEVYLLSGQDRVNNPTLLASYNARR